MKSIKDEENSAVDRAAHTSIVDTSDALDTLEKLTIEITVTAIESEDRVERRRVNRSSADTGCIVAGNEDADFDINIAVSSASSVSSDVSLPLRGLTAKCLELGVSATGESLIEVLDAIEAAIDNEMLALVERKLALVKRADEETFALITGTQLESTSTTPIEADIDVETWFEEMDREGMRREIPEILKRMYGSSKDSEWIHALHDLHYQKFRLSLESAFVKAYPLALASEPFINLRIPYIFWDGGENYQEDINRQRKAYMGLIKNGKDDPDWVDFVRWICPIHVSGFIESDRLSVYKRYVDIGLPVDGLWEEIIEDVESVKGGR